MFSGSLITFAESEDNSMKRAVDRSRRSRRSRRKGTFGHSDCR
jgi:hypothetical protein